jgi:2-polyprenyl-3-methyl-5-hydroxy-6-metoxy-1,4-benzoquinol methylase
LSKKIFCPQLWGGVVMDIGCGNGYYTSQFATVAQHIDAFDTNELALLFAKIRNSSENIDYSTEVEFKKKYNAIIFNDSLELNNSWQSLYDEAYKHLLPDGKIFITTPIFKNKNNVLINLFSKTDLSSKKSINSIKLIEKSFSFKKAYNKSFIEELEAKLKHESSPHTKTKFFLTSNSWIYQIFLNTDYCNHILFEIQSKKI